MPLPPELSVELPLIEGRLPRMARSAGEVMVATGGTVSTAKEVDTLLLLPTLSEAVAVNWYWPSGKFSPVGKPSLRDQEPSVDKTVERGVAAVVQAVPFQY